MSLLVETLDHGVLRLTFNRPQAANALNRATNEALVAALADATTNAAVRAVVLAGAGGRVFSAGADLREDLGPDGKKLRRELLMRSLLAVLDIPKPVVAQIHGKAVGGGAMIALLADEVVMAEGAALTMPELGFGLPSPIGITIIAARGGRVAAQALVQGGHVIGTETALRLGLAEAMEEDAAPRAARLGAMDARGYAVNKAWLNAPLRAALLSAVQAAEAAHAH